MVISEDRRYSLRFLSGRSQGGEYVLCDPIELIVGRSSEVDVILLEGMVSRRHARFSYSAGRLQVEDLGSTNGTFVNGERIQKCNLLEGDRILVGTSILKVVRTSKPFGTVPPRPDPALLDDHQTGEHEQIGGDLSEVNVPELLELFGTSRHDAVLELTSPEGNAFITVRDGRVLDCGIDSLPNVPATKIIMRLLGWNKGTFDVRPYKAPTRMQLDLQVPQLLVDGLFKLDALTVLKQNLPGGDELLVLAKPLGPKLSGLDERELNVLQLAHNGGSVNAVLDRSMEADLETAKRLLALLDAGYLRKA